MKKIVRKLLVISLSVSLVLINIPSLALLPSLTTIVSGVANPKAHGQATTNTVTKEISESLNELPSIK